MVEAVVTFDAGGDHRPGDIDRLGGWTARFAGASPDK